MPSFSDFLCTLVVPSVFLHQVRFHTHSPCVPVTFCFKQLPRFDIGQPSSTDLLHLVWDLHLLQDSPSVFLMSTSFKTKQKSCNALLVPNLLMRLALVSHLPAITMPLSAPLLTCQVPHPFWLLMMTTTNNANNRVWKSFTWSHHLPLSFSQRSPSNDQSPHCSHQRHKTSQSLCF